MVRQTGNIITSEIKLSLVRGIFGFGGSPCDQRKLFSVISVLYGPLLIIACWWYLFAATEKSEIARSRFTGTTGGFRFTKSNQPFKVLLVSYVVSGTESNLPAALILYNLEYVLRSNPAEIFLVFYLSTGVVSLSERLNSPWISDFQRGLRQNRKNNRREETGRDKFRSSRKSGLPINDGRDEKE